MSHPDRHLWLLPEDVVETFSARLGGLAVLTAAERDGLARRLTQRAKRQFLGARMLSRYALTERSGRLLGDWCFRRPGHGRPEPWPDAGGLRFNLSHTDGLIACVVTRGRACGVDVERTPVRDGAQRYLTRLFAGTERAELDTVPAHLRPAYVAAYWVLKEAYLKAIGIGLRRPLSDFAFAGLSTALAAPATVNAARPTTVIRLRDGEQPMNGWHFDLIHPSPDHVLAVATENGESGLLHTVTLSS
ncbi:4'-phosphopantetheinyl transferase family protein [Kribbella sp. NPDC050124]|uniref:4'-phosphopantetheinyl transferase family protein n=1 Tax=Kribbella sp. NPDC050124 TaxID=3364114 RepID=UPI0037B40F2A